MIEPVMLPYKTIGRDLIQEADVMIFRGTGIISGLIQRFSGSRYSHAAMASWHNGSDEPPILECIEFREGSCGGRISNLSRQVEKYDEQIDIYRPLPSTNVLKLVHLEDSYSVVKLPMHLNPKAVTNCMRKMTGLPYGWSRLWWLAKHHLLGARLWYVTDEAIDDRPKEINDVYPVCSTAVAASFNLGCGYDLMPNRSDNRMEPGDLAKSHLLNYLFTLKCDW